jgi:hypothetical protein
METELPTKVMLGQTLVLMQMTFLNNVRKVGRLVLSRTSCLPCSKQGDILIYTAVGQYRQSVAASSSCYITEFSSHTVISALLCAHRNKANNLTSNRRPDCICSSL